MGIHRGLLDKKLSSIPMKGGLRLTLHSPNAGDPASLKLRKARLNFVSTFAILFNFITAAGRLNLIPGLGNS
jgi:hypothetical protein